MKMNAIIFKLTYVESKATAATNKISTRKYITIAIKTVEAIDAVRQAAV